MKLGLASVTVPTITTGMGQTWKRSRRRAWLGYHRRYFPTSATNAAVTPHRYLHELPLWIDRLAFMASVTCPLDIRRELLASSLIAWQSMNPLALAECQHTDTHRGGRLGRTDRSPRTGFRPSQHSGSSMRSSRKPLPST